MRVCSLHEFRCSLASYTDLQSNLFQRPQSNRPWSCFSSSEGQHFNIAFSNTLLNVRLHGSVYLRVRTVMLRRSCDAPIMTTYLLILDATSRSSRSLTSRRNRKLEKVGQSGSGHPFNSPMPTTKDRSKHNKSQAQHSTTNLQQPSRKSVCYSPY